MWQDVRSELHPKGLEVVTVALDVGGAEHAGQWIDKAAPEHPALIDDSHVMDELFGIVNVPSGIWIDEDGVIVRPPAPAWPGRAVFRERMKDFTLPEDADPAIVHALEVTSRLTADRTRHLIALKDWVEHGPDSRFALTPSQVIASSAPRPIEHSQAAAHFELGQHLWRAGDEDTAVEHFKQAHRLHPENWTYKRQAWQFASPILQNAREVYGTDWASEVDAAGPENYYKSDL